MKRTKGEKAKKVDTFSRRKAVVSYLLNMADHTIRHSRDTEEQAEGVLLKGLLEKRLRELSA